MKKIIIIAVFILVHFSSYAQDNKTLYDEYKVLRRKAFPFVPFDPMGEVYIKDMSTGPRKKGLIMSNPYVHQSTGIFLIIDGVGIPGFDVLKEIKLEDVTDIYYSVGISKFNRRSVFEKGVVIIFTKQYKDQNSLFFIQDGISKEDMLNNAKKDKFKEWKIGVIETDKPDNEPIIEPIPPITPDRDGR